MWAASLLPDISLKALSSGLAVFPPPLPRSEARQPGRSSTGGAYPDGWGMSMRRRAAAAEGTAQKPSKAPASDLEACAPGLRRLLRTEGNPSRSARARPRPVRRAERGAALVSGCREGRSAQGRRGLARQATAHRLPLPALRGSSPAAAI